MLLFFPYLSVFASVHVLGDSHTREFHGQSDSETHYVGPCTTQRDGLDAIYILNFGEINVRCHILKQTHKQRELNEVEFLDVYDDYPDEQGALAGLAQRRECPYRARAQPSCPFKTL